METDVERSGERIEDLLEQLGALPDRRARPLAEELVRVVTDFYGAGLARAVELGSAAAPALVAELADDPLVGSLLVLHDLHPLGVRERVERALDALRPALGSGDVRLLDLDEVAGHVRVRLLTGRLGASSADRRVREAIERAAPEIVEVEIDTPRSEAERSGGSGGNAVPVSLRRKPAAAAAAAAGTPGTPRMPSEEHSGAGALAG